MKNGSGAAWVAWVLAALYYFYQYALRSAPAVMMPQLSDGFQITSAEIASLLGFFYYGYAAFSLVAGVGVDRLGARALVPLGALVTGGGALLFATGNVGAATAGRFLQGAGGVFALIGAIYVATRNFPASQAATLMGATQMFGMAGGAAGQFLVGPLIQSGVVWRTFWIGMGLAGIGIAGALWLLLPKEKPGTPGDNWVKGSVTALAAVFKNPQSVISGITAGLLFVPTTVFDMVWGVRFLQEAHGFDYGEAVIRSATVPFGWIIGCPLLGWLSDRIGRRKPVILGGGAVLLACLFWILFGRSNTFPPYVLGLVAGFASGCAMLLYTVIKEVNPPQFAGTATGVINLLNFALTAIMSEVFVARMQSATQGQPAGLTHYQSSFDLLLYGVALAIVLTFTLKETGRAARVRQKRMVTA
jgi:MFS family permease